MLYVLKIVGPFAASSTSLLPTLAPIMAPVLLAKGIARVFLCMACDVLLPLCHHTLAATVCAVPHADAEKAAATNVEPNCIVPGHFAIAFSCIPM